MSSSRRIKAGISMGDPAGIGPAVIAKGLKGLEGLADFTVIGDKRVFCAAKPQNLKLNGLNFIDLNNVSHKNFKFGNIRAEYGRASIEYLDKALELIRRAEIDCLVTCPISKEAVSLAGLKGFSGHTEYLAEKTKTRNFAMMLLNRRMKTVLVTRHIPLKKVASRISEKNIYETILLAHCSLKDLFSISSPRIAVCGLNPHASDNGILGEEENKIIKPALKRLRRKIPNVDGPLPADVAAFKAARNEYDCLIAMYHDQALIALKVSDPSSGVNATLGLPFVRTSPLHGTAFDIAGKFHMANPDSFREAVRLSVRCALSQKNH
ncbi:MAG: 4-hydroxythreonine-4-phosphate dehydrogenase PdxA [Candidatus Omnitrophica bacterium]|nr:4-hydroxythreonine-4-phosphate dehydrogenase PdxA [Candidatus Omnitrophota bacterium]MDD5553180.1 4-hydroxythreonine-4-phosphate dehydrogenase PdxA [Candidatus Omnitrophota bacterium]